MSNHGFESDAAYFDLVAHSADHADRRHLRLVAAAYRSLAKDGKDISRSRQEHWACRAATCRTLSEQFKHPECQSQLRRLAETYDLLAKACDESHEDTGRDRTEHRPALARGHGGIEL